MTEGTPGSPLDRTTLGGTEVERRFLVDRLPDDLESYPSDRLSQGYLAVDPAGAQVRLRRRGYHTLLTIKSGRGLARAEEEFVIDGPRFERLWPATEGRRVEKTRYKLPLDGGLTLELDVFSGALEGLVMAEVEFDSVEAALAFTPPDWLRPEVTEDRRYENARLALYGRPDRETVGASGLVDGEPVQPGLVHVTTVQIRDALAVLHEAEEDDREKAVHTARKALKRSRAFVRVARAGLGDEVAQRDNAALRDAGQKLSSTRDADVLVQTLDKLVARGDNDLEAAQVAGFREVLVAERDELHARANADEGVIAEVRDLLDATSADVASWTLGDEPSADLAAGLERILRKGRKALKGAEHEAGEERTEALHELRKRSKDLWHAAELLEVAAPQEARALQAQAHTLADHLGDDHDLAVLSERVASADPELFADAAAAGVLQDAISARRRKLQRKAIKLAHKVHQGHHRAFVDAVRALDS